MKKAIPFLLVAVVGMPCYGEVVDAYLLIGQSNACGRAYADEFSDASLAQPFDDNIHFAWRERKWQWPREVMGDLPLGAVRPHSTLLYAPNGDNMVGPEITLGRNLASLGNHVLLLSYTSGGTKIVNYLPESNNLYQPMLTYVNEQIAGMQALGYTEINWKGLFVVTGESDCRYENRLVDDRLLIIQESLENALGVSSLPLTYSLLKGNWVDIPPHEYSDFNYGAGIINDEVTALASIDSDVAVTVSNADLDTRYSAGFSTLDGVHYSADAYAAVGNRLFSAYMNMEYLGDANLDGVVNEVDAQILAANWSPRKATWEMGDFNGDGAVDDVDATLMAANWETTMKSFPGDANLDGAVNEVDARILATNWFLGEATWEMGDFNGDGAVDDIDATLMAANWDTTSAVPEPHAIISLVMGVMVLLMFSWKRPV